MGLEVDPPSGTCGHQLSMAQRLLPNITHSILTRPYGAFFFIVGGQCWHHQDGQVQGYYADPQGQKYG